MLQKRFSMEERQIETRRYDALPDDPIQSGLRLGDLDQ
jgi:hypothetical protein